MAEANESSAGRPLSTLANAERICFVVSAISVLIEEVSFGKCLRHKERSQFPKLTREGFADLLIQ